MLLWIVWMTEVNRATYFPLAYHRIKIMISIFSPQNPIACRSTAQDTGLSFSIQWRPTSQLVAASALGPMALRITAWDTSANWSGTLSPTFLPALGAIAVMDWSGPNLANSRPSVSPNLAVVHFGTATGKTGFLAHGVCGHGRRQRCRCPSRNGHWPSGHHRQQYRPRQ